MESYQTIDSIVRGALADIGENSITSKYQRFLHWAIEAVQDWNYDRAQEVKTIRLVMNNIKQAELPPDFVDFVKVGIQCGDKVKTMSVSDSIALLHETDKCGNPKPFDNCDCDANNLPMNYNELGGYYFYNYTNDNGEFLGGLYGYGGGYNDAGYFTIIRNSSPGVIQFNTLVNNTNVYLEYISTGFNPNKETVVNPYASKLIKEYIHWRRLWFAGDPRHREAKQYYDDELVKVSHRLFDLSLKDILLLSRRNYGQAIKY